MPSAHGPIFCHIQVWENIGVNIWFLTDCFSTLNWFFITDKKSDLRYDYLSECHFAPPGGFFYLSYCAVSIAVSIVGLPHSDFLSQRLNFLSYQKLVHTIQFSLIFCYDKKIGQCALGIMSYETVSYCSMGSSDHSYSAGPLECHIIQRRG